MKTLFIHAGFSKTGSSFLQSTFARHAADMAEKFGLHYALPHTISAERARKGYATSGNAHEFIEDVLRGRLVNIGLPPYLDGAEGHVLMSSEDWGRLQPEHLTAVRQEAERRGFQVRCIAFRRDPFELAISSYIQIVKASALSDSLETFTARFRYHHAEQESVLRQCLDLTLLDYESHKDDLAGALISEMGFDPRLLPPIGSEIVNRSLSREELHFMRALNARHKNRRLSASISNELVQAHEFCGTRLDHTWESFTNVCAAISADPEEETRRRGFEPRNVPLDPDALLLAGERILALLYEKLMEGQLANIPGMVAEAQSQHLTEIDAAKSHIRVLQAQNLCLQAALAGARDREDLMTEACGGLYSKKEFERLVRFLKRQGLLDMAVKISEKAEAMGLNLSIRANLQLQARKARSVRARIRRWLVRG